MKIFQRVQEIWSRQESAMDRLTDGLTDEGQSCNLLSAMRWGINRSARGSPQDHLLQTILTLKARRKKMHLKMSAEVVCCK